MASTYYVDGINGDDGNNGTTWVLAKKTIIAARGVAAAGDLVLIAPGVYPETYVAWDSGDSGTLYMADPTKAGVVIVDFLNVPAANPLYGHWYFNTVAYPRFMNIIFRNPGSAASDMFFVNWTTGTATFIHCVFHNQYGTRVGRVITGSGTASERANFYNCSFYNLDEGISHGSAGVAYNNYVENCNVAKSGHGDYNAYPGNTETNGIDTDVTNPGFRDAAGVDFRLDPDTTPADYAAFMTGGLFGDRIGAFGKGGYYYNPAYPQLRYVAPAPTVAQGNPQPSWENEGPNGTNTYTAGTPGDVIEDTTSFEPKLDLTPGGITGGRILSGVFNISNAVALLQAIAFSRAEFPSEGAIIDTNTTLPKKVEYRSQVASFLKDAGTPTWTEFTSGDDLSISGHYYFQLRITFQTAHTNA